MITFIAAFVVLTAIGIVSWPLLRGAGTKRGTALLQDSEVSELLTQKDATLFAINELESDYEIGSLSQGDYQELRGKYEEKAVALIKTVDELRGERGLDMATHIDDEIETRVASLRAGRSTAEVDIETRVSNPRLDRNTTGQDIEARVSKLRRAKNGAANSPSCPGCGAPEQPDAVFCSRCGAALNMKCPGCSAQVSPVDGFCSHCGVALST